MPAVAHKKVLNYCLSDYNASWASNIEITRRSNQTKKGNHPPGSLSVDNIQVGEAASTYILTTMVDITERAKAEKVKKRG